MASLYNEKHADVWKYLTHNLDIYLGDFLCMYINLTLLTLNSCWNESIYLNCSETKSISPIPKP